MNALNSFFSSMKRARSSSRFDPARDWLLLLLCSMILLTGIVVWNAWAFDTVAGGGVIGASPARTPSAFNQSSLDAIRTVFTDRAVEEDKYTSGVYRFADPSL
ncbi:MAG: hypothetical protein AAB709_00905 [Patescibacteria group bacterium]